MMVRLFLTHSFLSISMIRKAVEESRPLVGSSQRRTCGSVISSYPIDVRFLSPPEMPLCDMPVIPPTYVSLQFLRPSLFMRFFTLSSISSSVRLVRSFAAKRNCSTGVKVSRRMSSCCTNAPNFPKSCLFKGLPLHRISPVVAAPGLSPSLWPITLSSDVFPEPDAPIMANIWPGLAYPVILCKIYFFEGSLSSCYD